MPPLSAQLLYSRSAYLGTSRCGHRPSPLFSRFGIGGGNTMTVNGMLTSEATGQINLYGPGDVLQALAGLTNNGLISVNNGSSIDPPFLNNGGTITKIGR